MTRKLSKEERNEQSLRAALKSDCPDPMLLGEYHMGLLSDCQAESVTAHAGTCQHCQAELKMLGAFMEEPEPSSVFDDLNEIKEIVVEWGRSLLGSGMVPVGVRGAAAARAQTFTAGNLWMAVTVQEGEGGQKSLLGLVTREDGYPLEHGTAWLSQENRLVMGGRIDEAGNLVIRDLQPGEYDLGIQCDGTRVWVRGVKV